MRAKGVPSLMRRGEDYRDPTLNQYRLAPQSRRIGTEYCLRRRCVDCPTCVSKSVVLTKGQGNGSNGVVSRPSAPGTLPTR